MSERFVCTLMQKGAI